MSVAEPADDSYQIELRWKEELIYSEGSNSITFDCGWGFSPGSVYVPSAYWWDKVAPAWLRGRREIVVGRLAATGHTVRVREDDPWPR